MESRAISEIRYFFDKKSKIRDKMYEQDPIFRYEQKMRETAVLELLAPYKTKRILEVGCGNCRDILALAKSGAKCIGVDFSPEMIKEGYLKMKKHSFKANLYVGDAINLPFVDNSFDIVFSSETIEHIPNYERAIGEMLRVLKNNGKIVLTTPNMNSLYGITKKIYEFFFGTMQNHPYDIWKTEKVLIKVLTDRNVKIDRVASVCYLPGQVSYKLPFVFKKILVKMVERIEDKLHNVGYGYFIAVSGFKLD